MRRFIAGATCPSCGEQDKLFLYRNDDGQQVRECVRCQFTEVMEEQSPAEEPVTRVNQPNRLMDAPAETVRILDPGTPENKK